MPMKAEYDAGILAAIRIIQRDIDGDVYPSQQVFLNLNPEKVRKFAEMIARAVIDAAADARFRMQQRDE